MEGGGQGKYAKVDFEVTAATEVQSSVGSRGEKGKAICGLLYSPYTKEKKYTLQFSCYFSLLFSWKCVLGQCLPLFKKEKKKAVS